MQKDTDHNFLLINRFYLQKPKVCRWTVSIAFWEQKHVFPRLIEGINLQTLNWVQTLQLKTNHDSWDVKLLLILWGLDADPFIVTTYSSDPPSPLLPLKQAHHQPGPFPENNYLNQWVGEENHESVSVWWQSKHVISRATTRPNVEDQIWQRNTRLKKKKARPSSFNPHWSEAWIKRSTMTANIMIEEGSVVFSPMVTALPVGYDEIKSQAV